MDYEIIDFAPEYLSEIVEAEKICFPGDPWSREAFIDAVEIGGCKILCVKDMQLSKMIGYSAIYCVADQADLANIAVLPEYRRLNIGKVLLEKTMEKAREMGACEVFLEVRESNLAARRLYASSEFAEIGIRRNYYSSPRENAVIMMRKI